MLTIKSIYKNTGLPLFVQSTDKKRRMRFFPVWFRYRMQRRTEKVNSNFRIFDVERKMQINFSFVSRSHHISNFVWFTFFSAASMSVFLLKSLMQFFVCTTATGLHLCVCQKLTFENILRINDDLTSWAIEGITQKSMLI